MAPTQEGPPGLNHDSGQEPGDSDSEDNLSDPAGVQVQAGAGGDSPLQENVKEGGSCNRTTMVGWAAAVMVTMLSLVAVVLYQQLANQDLLAKLTELRTFNITMTANVNDLRTTLENIDNMTATQNEKMTKIEGKIDKMAATQNEMDNTMTKIEEKTTKNRIAITSGLIPKELEGKVEFRLNEGNFYAYSRYSKPFEEAKTLCQRLQMRLPTIESAEENNIIHQWAKETGLQPWLGLEKTDGVWMWQDGGNSTFRNWQEGYPRENGADCAYFDYSSGKWYDNVSCRANYYALCEE